MFIIGSSKSSNNQIRNFLVRKCEIYIITIGTVIGDQFTLNIFSNEKEFAFNSTQSVIDKCTRFYVNGRYKNLEKGTWKKLSHWIFIKLFRHNKIIEKILSNTIIYSFIRRQFNLLYYCNSYMHYNIQFYMIICVIILALIQII